MVSIKLAALLLALVCVFQMQETSAFLVKRDTPDASGQQLSLEGLQETFSKFASDAKKQLEGLAAKINTQEVQEGLKKLNDEWTKRTADIGAKITEMSSDAKKALEGASS